MLYPLSTQKFENFFAFKIMLIKHKNIYLDIVTKRNLKKTWKRIHNIKKTKTNYIIYCKKKKRKRNENPVSMQAIFIFNIHKLYIYIEIEI